MGEGWKAMVWTLIEDDSAPGDAANRNGPRGDTVLAQSIDKMQIAEILLQEAAYDLVRRYSVQTTSDIVMLAAKIGKIRESLTAPKSDRSAS